MTWKTARYFSSGAATRGPCATTHRIRPKSVTLPAPHHVANHTAPSGAAELGRTRRTGTRAARPGGEGEARPGHCSGRSQRFFSDILAATLFPAVGRKYLRTRRTRPVQTEEPNKPHATHPLPPWPAVAEQSRAEQRRESLLYPVSSRVPSCSCLESRERAVSSHGKRVQHAASPGGGAASGRRRRAVRGQDVPHGERPGHGRHRLLGRRQQHLPRPRPGRLLRLPPPFLLQAPQLRKLRPPAQHLRLQEGGHGPVGVRSRVVPTRADAPAAADRAQEEEAGKLQGAVQGRGGGARHHRGGAEAAAGAAGHGPGAAGHGPPSAGRRDPPGPDDGVPRQARRRTRRRAPRHARQEGGAGRSRARRRRQGLAGVARQEAPDRGRRRCGAGSAGHGRRAVPVLCPWPSVLLEVIETGL